MRSPDENGRQKDHFYKSLTPEQNAIAHRDEYDFDSPDAIDFDVLVEILRDLKQGYWRNGLYIWHSGLTVEKAERSKYPSIRSQSTNERRKPFPFILHGC